MRGVIGILTFVPDPTQLDFLDRENRWFVESGSYTLYAGSSSEELPLTAGFAVEKSVFISGKNRSFMPIYVELWYTEDTIWFAVNHTAAEMG